MSSGKRKKRFSEAELLARLRRYEEVLKRLNVDIGEVNKGNSVSEIIKSTKRIQITSGPRDTVSEEDEHPDRYQSVADTPGASER